MTSRSHERLDLVSESTRPDVEAVVTGVVQDKLSYLRKRALRDLVEAVTEAEETGRPGIIIECGTALGGSAIVMTAAKSPDRTLRAYDVFGMIPPPTEVDGPQVQARYETIKRGDSAGIRGDTYYGYRDDLLAEVKASFARYGLPVEESNVELIQGYFEDTLHVDGPVALAHLDGDWYESTKVCLERIVPNLSPGGRLVIDDYEHWQGCRRAVDEYFESRPGFEFQQKRRLHIVKT